MPRPALRHPLDKPAWSALTTRQAHLARSDGPALGFDLDFGMFVAAPDETPESLAALTHLIPPGGQIARIEATPFAEPPGARAVLHVAACQMIADRLTPGEAGLEPLDLTEADAPQMLALAKLTEPGPFFTRTHQLGAFVGVKSGGRLVAMAGERMRPDGFTEVSAVCTHPDFRGRGYARGLMRTVAARILERGEAAFLHVLADNAGAIGLYESLGFRLRSPMTIMVLERI